MNRIKRFFIASTAAALLLTNTVLPASAAPLWDVTGSYDITFMLDSDPTPYVHDATLTQTGSDVDGTGGYPAGGSYTYEWDVTAGTVSGNTIDLTVIYTAGAVGTTMEMTGTIAPDGSMSGTWTDNFGGVRSGTWSTTEGEATVVAAIPEQCEGMIFPNDPIMGTNGSDSITGTSGNDLIFAGNGSDKVEGLGGDDCIVGANGSDKLLGGNGEDVILGGNGSDTLEGGNNADMLFGEQGPDTLRGDNGPDTLDGGAGPDAARGGDGADTCTAESEQQCEL